MGLITRTAFWGFLGLVALPSLMPAPVEDAALGGTTVSSQSADVSISPFEAIGFAAGVAQDLRALCERNPQTCETGRKIADIAIVRAREGASIAAGMIGDYPGVPDRLTTGGIETGLPVPKDRPLH